MDDVLLTKLLYFSTTLMTTSWGRFQNIYFLHSGFSIKQVGILQSLTYTAKAITRPMWGIIIDYFGNTQGVLSATIIISCMILEVFRGGWAFYSVYVFLFSGFAVVG
eukprot:UN17964